MMYRLLRKFDEKMMRLPNNPFRRVKLPDTGADIIEVSPLQKKYSDYFPADTIGKIRSYQPDLLLRFGFRILRGEILKASRFGVLSLHHGDTNEYRGGPPAFWEVVNKAPLTAVTLQLLTEKLDAGIVLDKCFLRTDINSFYRNQQKLYWAGMHMFRQSLGRIADQGADVHISKQRDLSFGDSKGRLYRNPGNIESITIAGKYKLRNAARIVRRLFMIDQWQIAYTFGHPGSLSEDLASLKRLTPPKDRIWADPFVIEKDDRYYLFIEEKLYSKEQAHISLFEFDNKGNLLNKHPEIILKEDHHLSYPFVFSHNNKYYMVPESAATREVVLYEAMDFPRQWKKKRVLLSGEKYYDATLHHHDDGRWYLFCSQKQDDRYSSDAYLHIYSSNDLLHETFEPHPMNPIYQDVRIARPAGRIIKSKQGLIRPSQLCSPVYGYGINFNLINKLDRSDFREELLQQQLPVPSKKITGTHSADKQNSFFVTDILVPRLKW